MSGSFSPSLSGANRFADPLAYRPREAFEHPQVRQFVQLRAVVKKHGYQGFVGTERRKESDRRSHSTPEVRVRAGIEECFHETPSIFAYRFGTVYRVPSCHGLLQGRHEVRLSLPVHIGAQRQQAQPSGKRSGESGRHERREALSIQTVHFGAGFDQQVESFHRSRFCCPMEGTTSVAIP